MANNVELTPSQEEYYVVGGSVDAAEGINDAIVSEWVENVSSDPFIPAVQDVVVFEKDHNNVIDLVGQGEVTATDGVNGYWIVGGVNNQAPATNPTEDPVEDGD